jgi:hypothetical protein
MRERNVLGELVYVASPLSPFVLGCRDVSSRNASVSFEVDIHRCCDGSKMVIGGKCSPSETEDTEPP